jgi:hypothetical protein
VGVQHPEPEDIYPTVDMPTTADIMARLGEIQISHTHQYMNLVDSQQSWYERYAALVREQSTGRTFADALT